MHRLKRLILTTSRTMNLKTYWYLYIWLIVNLFLFLFLALPKIQKMMEHRVGVVQVGSIPSINELNDDYVSLKISLSKKNWKEADEISKNIINKSSVDDKLLNLSCVHLQKIDRLWEEYSNDRYGFNTQRDIFEKIFYKRNYAPILLPWEELNSDIYYSDIYSDIYSAFVVEVGWVDPPIERLVIEIESLKEKDFNNLPLEELIKFRNDIYMLILESIKFIDDTSQQKVILDRLSDIDSSFSDLDLLLMLNFNIDNYEKSPLLVKNQIYKLRFEEVFKDDLMLFANYSSSIEGIVKQILSQINSDILELSSEEIKTLQLNLSSQLQLILGYQFAVNHTNANFPEKESLSGSEIGFYPALTHFSNSEDKYFTSYGKTSAIFQRIQICDAPVDIIKIITQRE